MRYSQELLDRARAYLDQPLTARRYDAGLVEIGVLYAAITGEPAAKCRQCKYSDYLAVVTAYTREATRFLHPDTMADSKYILAPGYEHEIFVHENYRQATTAETLTDEAAEFFLQHGYGHAFLRKDGQPVAAAATEGNDKPKLEKKADYQARFKELFGTEPTTALTIAQLAEHIADAGYEVPAA